MSVYQCQTATIQRTTILRVESVRTQEGGGGICVTAECRQTHAIVELTRGHIGVLRDDFFDDRQAFLEPSLIRQSEITLHDTHGRTTPVVSDARLTRSADWKHLWFPHPAHPAHAAYSAYDVG